MRRSAGKMLVLVQEGGGGNGGGGARNLRNGMIGWEHHSEESGGREGERKRGDPPNWECGRLGGHIISPLRKEGPEGKKGGCTEGGGGFRQYLSKGWKDHRKGLIYG